MRFHRSTSILGIVALSLLAATATAQVVTYDWSRTLVRQGGWITSGTRSGLVLDQQGNTYYYALCQDSTDLDLGPAVQWSSDSSGYVIAKYDTAGALIWAVDMGNVGFYEISDLALDEANGLFAIAGSYEAPFDVDPGPNTVMLTGTTGDAGYVVVFDTAGHYQSSMHMGYAVGDGMRLGSVEFTAQHKLLVAGQFYGDPDIDPVGTTILPYGGWRPFMAQYSLPLDLEWYFGVGLSGWIDDLHVMPNGHIAITGTGSGTNVDFDGGPGHTHTDLGTAGNRGFLALYDSSRAFQWVRTWGRSLGEMTNHDVLGEGNDELIVTGTFSIYQQTGAIDLDPTAGVHSIHPLFWGRDDGRYIAKLDGAGNYVWSVAAPKEEIYYSSYSDWITLMQGQVLFTGLIDERDDLPLIMAGGNVNLLQNTACSYTVGEIYNHYVCALDAANGALLWHTRDTALCTLGSTSDPQMASHPDGTVMLAGYYNGAVNGAMSLGVDTLAPLAAVQNVFFTKLHVTLTTNSDPAAPLDSNVDHGTLVQCVVRDVQGKLIRVSNGPLTPATGRALDLPTGIYLVQETWSDGYVRLLKMAIVE